MFSWLPPRVSIRTKGRLSILTAPLAANNSGG
jgi:hypothetical protein